MEFHLDDEEVKNIIKEGLINGFIVELSKPYLRNEPVSPIESAAKKEDPLFFFNKVFLQPTGYCDRECDFCNIFLNCCCFKGDGEWGSEEVENLLKELERFKGMIGEIAIFGGNPFLYSELQKLISGLNKIEPASVNINVPFPLQSQRERSEISKLKSNCNAGFKITFLVLPGNEVLLPNILKTGMKSEIKLLRGGLINKEIANTIEALTENLVLSQEYLLKKDLSNLKGNVKPCLWSNYIFGNWNKGKIMHILDDIKNTELFWLDNNLEKIEGCNNCIYRFGCKDCRVIAEFLTGNHKAKNPLCKK